MVIAWMAQLYGPEHHDEERARHGLDHLFTHPDCGSAFVIEADGIPAGYLVMTTGFSLEFHGRFGLLDELFVEPAWRNRGLGTQALAFAEGWCHTHGMRALRLEVSHENTRALALYRRCGFGAPDRHLLSKQV